MLHHLCSGTIHVLVPYVVTLSKVLGKQIVVLVQCYFQKVLTLRPGSKGWACLVMAAMVEWIVKFWGCRTKLNTAQQCLFYKLKKLKTDMMFEKSFKNFKCFWETIICFNFAAKCYSFYNIALLLTVLMTFGHFP